MDIGGLLGIRLRTFGCSPPKSPFVAHCVVSIIGGDGPEMGCFISVSSALSKGNVANSLTGRERERESQIERERVRVREVRERVSQK